MIAFQLLKLKDRILKELGLTNMSMVEPVSLTKITNTIKSLNFHDLDIKLLGLQY
jgi:hypothetical protein